MNQEMLEKTILAHMLDSTEAIEFISGNGITKEHFSYSLPKMNKPYYPGLFELIVNTYQRQKSLLTKNVFIDKMAKKMGANGIKKDDINNNKAGLISMYDDIAMEPVNSDELNYFIRQLKDHFNRQLIKNFAKVAKDLETEAYDVGNDAVFTHVLSGLSKYINDNMSTNKKVVVSTRDLMRDTDWLALEMQDRIDNPEKYKGVYMGIPPIDDVTNGFRAGQLIIFIGQVATGKTTLLKNLAYNVCAEEEKDILFFSLEMMEWMISAKFNARDMKIDYSHIRDGKLSEEEKKIFFDRLEKRKTHPAGFWHKEMFGTTDVINIEKEIRTEFDHGIPIKAIFVDYLGIIDSTQQEFGQQRWEQLAKISEKLRDLAIEFNVPIITAVQANRQTIKKIKDDVKKSEEADLFGVESVSGSMGIANTADLIFGIHTYWDEGKMRIHQVKNREGSVPTFNLKVIPSESYIGYDPNDDSLQAFNSGNFDEDDATPFMSENGSIDIIQELSRVGEETESNDLDWLEEQGTSSSDDELDSLDDLNT